MAPTTVAISFTHEQRAAITARGFSVALSAGAGCGKTFVLTERFLAELAPASGDDPRQLSEVVAITFTDAAAREMRHRIRQKCNERLLAAATPEESDHWLGLLRQLERARVSTIHSFCASLLRANAVEAGLDPRFGLLEPNQAATLVSGLIDDELRRQLSEADEPLLRLIVDYGLGTLRTMIGSLVARRQRIDFDAWLKRSPDELAATWHEFQETVVWPAMLRKVCDSREARTILRILATTTPTHAKMAERCRRVKELLGELEQSRRLADLEELRAQATVQHAGGAKAWNSEQQYAQFRDAAEALRKNVDKARESLAFDPDEARAAAAAGLDLLRVVRPILEAYEDRKRELNLLDFDDLLVRADELLLAPGRKALRKRVASSIGLLLVDEFQDTDPLQVRLVESLCGSRLTEGKLFFVGDYKQSIYRFRQADPRVFRQLRERMPPAGRLPLVTNFRSQAGVIDFVNALFVETLGPNYESLKASRPSVADQPAVEFLWAVGDGDAEEDSPGKAVQRIREADWIARRLRQLIDSGEPLVHEKGAAGEPPRLRAVRPGDVAILFRALSDIQYYEAALRRAGLEYYVVGGHAFYAQQEVFDVLNVLRAIASPADALSLAGALRSPIFALSDETLFWLSRGEGGLTAGLFRDELPRELSAEDRQRARFAAETLRELRLAKDRLSITELLREVLDRTAYDATLVAEYMGQRKLANLNKLLEQARSMDRSGVFTLTDFIGQLSEFVARQSDEALAATSAATADVVRLMSIHASKGLEFPVVVVADLERKSRASNIAALFDPTLGPLVKHPAGKGCCGLKLFKCVEELEDAAEMARLLYVATTRAADYLILSSGIKSLDEPAGDWTRLVAERFDLRSGAPTFEPGGAAPLPRVRVTTTEPPAPLEGGSKTERLDLDEVVNAARQLAKQGGGLVPATVAPIDPRAGARRGYSFSRLKPKLTRSRASADADDLGLETAPTLIDGRGLGTLVHEVLAAWDFGRPGDVARSVRSRAGRHALEQSPEVEAAVEMLKRFVASPRAAELGRAKCVHRELPFMLAWPPGGKKAGNTYLEGVIDCLYQDAAGDWHLLDYKTDDVAAKRVAEAASRYRLQLHMYAWAAEEVLGQPPKSVALHFLRPGVEHAFDWNDAARRSATDELERALAAAQEE